MCVAQSGGKREGRAQAAGIETCVLWTPLHRQGLKGWPRSYGEGFFGQPPATCRSALPFLACVCFVRKRAGRVGTPEGSRKYGYNGRIPGPVIGCYGGGSPDLGGFLGISVTADWACAEVRRDRSMPIPQARAVLKRQLVREWGHHAARGGASLLLGRLRGFAGSPEVDGEIPQPGANHLGPGSVAAYARWGHANGHQGTNHSTYDRRV